MLAFVAQATALGAVGIGYLAYAHYRGKNIHYLFKRTKSNFELLAKIVGAVPEYSPTIYLPSSYLKTLSTFQTVSKPKYKRRVIKGCMNGSIALDYYNPDNYLERAKEREESTPIVVIVPGFGTHSEFQYIYNAAQEIHDTLGWDVVVFNQKGMGGVEFTGDDLLGYFSTKDLELVLQHLKDEYADIHLLGFSVGGNLIQNLLTDLWDVKRELEEEEVKADGAQNRLKKKRPYTRDVKDVELLDQIVSSACISPIYHFETACKRISSKPWLNPVLNLKFFDYIKSNLAHEDFRKAMERKSIDLNELKKLKTFRELNSYIIRKGLNVSDETEAFDLISPWQHLDQMYTPMCCISSSDDILVDNYHLPIKAALTNEKLFLALVHSGGHISYSHGMTNKNWSVLFAQQYMKEIQEKKAKEAFRLLAV